MLNDSSTSEANLVSRAARGCEASFRCLFERYYPAIHAYAWRLCGDSAAADDIAQQTFIKAAASFADGGKCAHFKAWIHRIALNTSRDYLRATARYRKRLENLETPTSPAPPDIEKLDDIAELLAKLSESLRETVLLVFAQGLTHKEAAMALQCSEGTIAWRISEARRILRQTTNPRHGRPA